MTTIVAGVLDVCQEMRFYSSERSEPLAQLTYQEYTVNLFDSTSYSTEPEKLPTLKQYLKRIGKTKLPNQFHVHLIWVPNKFPSFSIEADLFRVVVPVKSALGKTLKANIDELVKTEIAIALAVQVTGDSGPTVQIKRSKEQGEWVPIGDEPIMGYKFVR